MTPEAKALDLYSTYRGYLSLPGAPLGDMKDQIAIDIALHTIDEIQEAIDFDWMEIQNLDNTHRWWNLVKDELNKLR